jgi:hypothetical protein
MLQNLFMAALALAVTSTATVIFLIIARHLFKPAGVYVTHCPFHQEKTPSLLINGDRAYCIGCGWSGPTSEALTKMFEPGR